MRRRPPSRHRRVVVALLVGALAGVAPAVPPAAAFTLALTRMAVTPTSSLHSGQPVSVLITHGAPGTTYVVAECGARAYTLLLTAASVQDGCDSLHTSVVTVDPGGVAATTLPLPAVLTTASGAIDCRATRCFVAAEALHSTGGLGLLIKNLSFAEDACRPAGSCSIPADAWDPSLGPAPAGTVTPARLGVVAPEAATRGLTSGVGDAGSTVPTSKVGDPVEVSLAPVAAGSLLVPGSVTGPYTSKLPRPARDGAGAAAGSGEGLLRLALAAPRTSWGPGAPSSTVVDATVLDLTTGRRVGRQQFVLFWGASPFVYAGFTGPVTTADRYRVVVQVEPGPAGNGLSRPVAGAPPQARVLDEDLEVVSPTNPQYLAYAYAPVLYGRSTSALHDVPLLGYANARPAAGGATTLSYVFVWSHEDGGTGFLPFLLWGRWGRMADIETAMSFTVAADGSVSRASYLSGGQPSTGFPDSNSALTEGDRAFTGTWSGHHPVLRVATGNDDFSDQGSSRFRFQPAPVAAPAPGQLRDQVMDANPFTYTVTAEEIPRWYGQTSTDPASPLPGQASQYAVVDLDSVADGPAGGPGVTSLAVALRLSGSAQWFSSDHGWEYPLSTTGRIRTVVKLPLGWPARTITGVRVAVNPDGAAAGLSVKWLRVERVDPAAVAVYPVRTPTPTVVPEVLSSTPGLTVHAQGPSGVRGDSSATGGLSVVVHDQAGAPFAGATITFTLDHPPAGAHFAHCDCTSQKVTSSAAGRASSGPVVAPGSTGPVRVTATSADPGASTISG